MPLDIIDYITPIDYIGAIYSDSYHATIIAIIKIEKTLKSLHVTKVCVILFPNAINGYVNQGRLQINFPSTFEKD